MASSRSKSKSLLQGWRDGSVTIPSLLILLAALIVGALGGASIGGTVGLAIIVAVLVGMLGLLITWSSAV